MARSARVVRWIALAAIATAGTAHAEPTTTDKALAEALFRDAKDLRDAGKLAEACPKFAESHRIDPKPGTILNLATCHEMEGRTASAWVAYNEAASLASRARQADREKFARSKVEELEKKLSYLKFDVAPANASSEGFSLSVDGKILSSAASGTRIPIDPGEHEAQAHAPGKRPWTDTIVVSPGPSEKIVVIAPLGDEAAAPAASPSSPAPAESLREASTQRTLGWVALGVGAASVAVGAVFGIKTIADKETVDEHCSGSFCNAEGLDANESAKSAANISTIAFVAAGVFVVGGFVLLVTAPSSRSTTAALRLAPNGFHAAW